MPPSARPAEIPPTELAAVIRSATGRVADPTDPAERPASTSLSTPIVSGTAGVWTVRGPDWTAVLKLLHRGDTDGIGHPHWQAGADPRHWYYWRREAEFYSSRLPALIEPDLNLSACYAVADRPDGTVAIWLERLSGWANAGWPLDHYHRIARRTGRLQGRLTGAQLPDEPWLGRDWLAAYQEIRRTDGEALDDSTAWAHPLATETGARARAGEYRALWEARTDRLAQVSALPRTLCHFDLHPYNLFDHDGRLGAIDWAFTGHGGIGEDMATLVFDTVFDFHVHPDELDRLFAEVLDGYLLGLTESGYRAEREEIRRAVLVTAAAKYCWTVPTALRSLALGLPLLNNRPTEPAARWWLAAGGRLLDLVATLPD
jgi:hypothetical protein